MKKITVLQVKKKLSLVLDPELGISVVDLGLIYKISIKNNHIHILMTLTSIGCPLYQVIEDEMKASVSQLGIDKKDISIELTFDPPWSMELVSPSGRAYLGW